MPKIKTNRAAAKRFRKTGTGKYKFSKSLVINLDIFSLGIDIRYQFLTKSQVFLQTCMYLFIILTFESLYILIYILIYYIYLVLLITS